MIVGNIIRLGVRAFKSTAMYDWIYLTQHPHIIQIHVIVWRWLSFFILTGEFRAQRASNAENVPVWWRHHAWARFTNILRGCCICIGVIIRLLRCRGSTSRPVFTEWTDVLPQDLVKYRSRRVGCCNGLIAHKIWQASWLRCCRGPCKISERYEKYKPKSRSFETSRDLAVERSFANHNNKKTLREPCISWGHDDVIKWKHFPRYWPFVWGIYRSPVNSPHKGQWLGALMLPLIWARTNGWVNNGEAGDLRRHRAYYDVTVMVTCVILITTMKRSSCDNIHGLCVMWHGYSVTNKVL